MQAEAAAQLLARTDVTAARHACNAVSVHDAGGEMQTSLPMNVPTHAEIVARTEQYLHSGRAPPAQRATPYVASSTPSAAAASSSRPRLSAVSARGSGAGSGDARAVGRGRHGLEQRLQLVQRHGGVALARVKHHAECAVGRSCSSTSHTPAAAWNRMGRPLRSCTSR